MSGTTAVSARQYPLTPQNDFIPVPESALNQTVSERFAEQAALHAERVAVKDDRRTWTYGELNRAANRLARDILARLGDGAAPVAVVLPHGAQTILAVMAVLKAGKFYVSLDPGAPEDRIRYVLADSGCRLALVSNGTEDRLRRIAVTDVPQLNLESTSESADDSDLERMVCPDDVLTILYTSGSTGTPKGVIRTHRTTLHASRKTVHAWHLCPDDRMAMLASHSVGAGVGSVFGALLCGAGLYAFDLRAHGFERLAEWLNREQITLLRVVPTVFRNLMGCIPETLQFPSMRLVGFGGETVQRRDVDLWRMHFGDHCLLRLGMKSTEGAGLGVEMFIDRSTVIPGEVMPAGYPVEGTEILITDDDGNDVGNGRVGEIVLKGRTLSPGYWRRPDLTQRSFTAAAGEEGVRLYRTGDLGRRDPDGCVYPLGRKDAQVKVRGHRIETGEVERALMGIEGVASCAVAVRNDRRGDARLVAYVVSRNTPPPTVTALRAGLAQRLPDSMLPGAFVFLDQLPALPNGKVDRAALPPPATARPRLAFEFVAPRDALEEKLATIWRDILGLDEVGVRDNFFELGGHSLAAARLFARIEKAFGRSLPLRTLLRAPTIETLAAVLDLAPEQGAPSCLVELQAGKDRMPFYCAAGAALDVLTLAPLARALGPEQPFYGLQPLGLDGVQSPHAIVEEMAAHYVAAIRAHQPEGPYLLGGRCFGGFVAFEMARLLHAQGQRVALLALIDSSQPPPMTTFSGHVRQLLTYHLPRHELLYCLRRDVHEQMRKLARKFSLRRQSRQVRRVWRAHTEARRRWAPKTYPGQATLFQSVEFSTRFPEYRSRWESLVGGGVECHLLAGAHHGMLRESRIEELAQILRTCLDRVHTNR